MPIERLTSRALRVLIDGRIKTKNTCVIKFYAPACQLCHALQGTYHRIADDPAYKDVRFFAFNIYDHRDIDVELGFKGPPTIILLKTGEEEPNIQILPEPIVPHPKTWYTDLDITHFLNDNI